MNPRTRTILLPVAAAVAVVAVALAGYLIVSQRAAGSGRAAIPAATPSSLHPSGSATASASPLPEPRHWLVAMLRRKVAVYTKPMASGEYIKTYLPARDEEFGVQTVCLVNRVRETPAKVWYNVWLPTGPNGARGWIAEGGVTTYPVSSKIVIDLSARKLTVIHGDGSIEGQYPVAIGASATPTPTGHFFITTKIRVTKPNSGYGVFAMALSAYSPTLAGTEAWGTGQIAIHGTYNPSDMGQAISHGCIRMLNKDVLKVHELVETGSPVIIKE